MKLLGLVQGHFCRKKLDGLWTFRGDAQEEPPLVLAALKDSVEFTVQVFTSDSLIDDQRPNVVHDF